MTPAAATTAALAGLNLWSPEPERVADLLHQALGVPMRRRDRGDCPHFSAVVRGLALSLHPREQPLVELAFVTPDLDLAIAKCGALGSGVAVQPRDETYGRATHMIAPGGLRFELVRTRAPVAEPRGD